MSEATDKGIRLSKVAREFNLGLHTVVEFLEKNGHKVESNPNTKIAGDVYDLLLKQFGTDKEIKAQSQQVVQQRQERETISLVPPPLPKEEPPAPKETPAPAVTIAAPPPAPAPPPAAPEPTPVAADKEPEVIKARIDKAVGPKHLGKIDLEAGKKGPKKVVAEPVKEAPAPVVEPAAPEAVAAPEVPAGEVPAPAPVDPSRSSFEVTASPIASTEPETIRVNVQKLAGLKTLGKIELPVERERKPSDKNSAANERGRRKRICRR